MPITDSFGFLEYEVDLAFDWGSIKTRSDIIEVRRALGNRLVKDGYIYPPRPSEMFKLPPSHNLILNDERDVANARRGLGGLIMHLLAFLFGKRLQFHDWWFAYRIPLTATTINISLHDREIHKFLDKSATPWRSFDELNRSRIVNLLIAYSLAGALEWDWQRFQLEYMVMDACYRIAKEKDNCRARCHEDRLRALSNTYGLMEDLGLFRFFVRLRNELFHETFWDGGQIFTSQTAESFHASFHLRRFNHRVIVALLYGGCPYIETDWTAMGTFFFSL